MADLLKIISPIVTNNRTQKVQNVPKGFPGDTILDLTNTAPVEKEPLEIKESPGDGARQALLQNLNKQIFEPLMRSTKEQADSLRKLVAMAKLFETSTGMIAEGFLEKIFQNPQELLDDLIARDKGQTVFKGEFFDGLRAMAKLEGEPRLKDAIVSILKHYDCYVNQEQSLKAILNQSHHLSSKLFRKDAELLRQQIDTFTALMDSNKGDQKTILSFLKNQYVPLLGKFVSKYQQSPRIHSPVMAIIHQVVRYDRADPQRIEEAVYQFGEELKQLTTVKDEELVEMKNLIFEHAKEARALSEKQIGTGSMDFPIENGESMEGTDSTKNTESKEKAGDDLIDLISKALDKSQSAKMNGLAKNILLNMLQTESPIFPLLHFMIPFRYEEENTYVEFFIDKNCKERKGEGTEAKNIFFTIQSDKFGNFEVDLLARDQRIDLDIKCPENMVQKIHDTKERLNHIVEEQGYRLTSYEVGPYKQSKTILQRFPKLAYRKVGIDVRI